MVLDDLTQREKHIGTVSILAVAAALLVGFGAGTLGPGESQSQGSTDEVREVAESLVEQQEASQEQQFGMIANQSENISEEDLSFNAEIDDISESDFGSLYKVDISITGDTVSQLGQVESIDEEQSIYISSDGRYLFQQPTDLEAQQTQEQSQAQQPSAPSGQTQ
ncbi:MAG: hypothetical protein R6V35_05840 [Candidatus Nanohaloarchaea archaeon]